MARATVLAAVVIASQSGAAEREEKASGLPEAQYPGGAAGQPFEPPASAGLPESAGPTVRLHDGFFLRISSGLGYYRFTEGRDGSTMVVSSQPAVAYDLLLGGTPWRGVVVGGGVLGIDVTTPTDVDSHVATLGYAGFIQYYPDPHRGFHLQALGGFSILVEQQSSRSGPSPSLAGAIGAVGLGEDFWIGAQTSLGLFLRAGYAAGRGSTKSDPFDPSSGSVRMDATSLFGTATFTFTWH